MATENKAVTVNKEATVNKAAMVNTTVNTVQNPPVAKKRMANMELLRILAMMMVVMLHYLSKGKVLPDMTGPLTVNGYIAHILETLSIVAVNVYMLISGFFLVESGFKCRRLLQLVCQVLFYSVLIPPVLIALGFLSPAQLDIYSLLRYVFPAEMEHYWFVTAYVVMYLFSPVLSTAVKHMKKRQLQYTIILLLLFFSVNKSILPVHLEMDRYGYDGIWFICVYLVAAYMRLYGFAFFDHARRGFICYFGSCAGILGIALGIRIVFLETGRLENLIRVTYDYNHILNLFAAISLFYGFYYCKLKEGWFSRLVIKIAPYTFGVYLLHEHLNLRSLWPMWMRPVTTGNPVIFVLRCLVSVFLVFAAGIVADMLRGLIFKGVGHLLSGSRADRFLKKIDERMSGREE